MDNPSDRESVAPQVPHHQPDAPADSCETARSDRSGRRRPHPNRVTFWSLNPEESPHAQISVDVDHAAFIGSGPASDIRVCGQQAAALHAQVFRQGDRVFLRALDAPGPTWVGNEDVREEPYELQDGDLVGIGKSWLMVSITPRWG